MKLTFGKKILLLIYWVLSVMLCAALAVIWFLPDGYIAFRGALQSGWGMFLVIILGIAAVAIYIALSVAILYVFFIQKKRADKGFIVTGSDEGDRVRIAISAIEQMVRRSVRDIDGISDMRIDIDSEDEAVVIRVKAVLINGNHVPSITSNMQHCIRSFVETNCGVSVKSVSISIDSVSNQSEPLRRRFARSKTRDAGGESPSKDFEESTPTAVPYTESTDTEPVDPAVEPVQEVTPAAGTSEIADAAPEVSSYDFDKPYESDFAKDLAAMKAREAEASAGPEDVH